MATRTIANGGGNWSANGTWVEGIAPTSSDNVVATATSGDLVINSSTACLCASADFTNYVGTLSGSGASIMRVYGNLTFSTGMTITATCTIGVLASGTWTSNGKVWTGSVQPLAPSTVTLADNFICALNISHSSTGGAFVLNGANFYLGGNYTASSGRTISGTALMVLNTSTTQTVTVSGTLSVNVEINATGDVIFTGVNVSGGLTITYVTAGSFTHTGLLSVLSSMTINTPGISWNNVTLTANSTITINSLWLISGTLTINTVSVVFAGTDGWTCGTFMITTGNHTMQSGRTYTVNTFLNVDGTAANTSQLFRSSAGTPFYFILSQGATQDVDFLDTNEMDSSGGLTIWTYRGTVISSTNVKVMPTQPQTRSY